MVGGDPGIFRDLRRDASLCETGADSRRRASAMPG